jgi:CRISPR-associated protein Cmr4
MNTNAYLITAKSNLHVGAGSSNYGVIDNLVQRDATDNFPTIYASSLKGAMREWFEDGLGKGKPAGDSLFGSADNGKSKVIFSDAHLLALPVRSNKRPYFMATCPYLIRKFLTIYKEDFKQTFDDEKDLFASILSGQAVTNGNPLLINETPEANLVIEDFENIIRFPIQANQEIDTALKNQIANLFGIVPLVLFSDEDMKYLCSDYALPVLARNNLENGQSKNLWYEQVIPRQTVFYFILEEDNNVLLSTEYLTTPIVQIGANSTIGYGRCEIKTLN